jgi:hypothetical protein
MFSRSIVTPALLVHPGLADHLAARVRTGTFCSYQPDPKRPVVWDLGPSGRR